MTVTAYYTKTPTSDTCAVTQAGPLFVDGDGASYTVGNIIDTIVLAADPASFEFEGKAPVAATSLDAMTFGFTAKECGQPNADSSAEVSVDYAILVDGAGNKQPISVYNDPEEGGVSLDTEIGLEVGATYCFNVCFRTCLDKAELAALPLARAAAEKTPTP